ncbi:ORF16 [Xestia c-nigrum granulovirus]|uniref:ORF16 n=1 Tax=Xestia c-nigrum granulosis virus TaxID=51677 RepID=Q9PZ27_GVXN|nr:ORF16 [Xestia c-nigrum granulovirus]AAF05130.1 ORF16 [Xestia c-nigrum granulovirus]
MDPRQQRPSLNKFNKLPLADQLTMINCMKSDMIKVTTRHERLARIEKHPEATQHKLRVLRETYLLALADMV